MSPSFMTNGLDGVGCRRFFIGEGFFSGGASHGRRSGVAPSRLDLLRCDAEFVS
jgi:hypothetical protein